LPAQEEMNIIKSSGTGGCKQSALPAFQLFGKRQSNQVVAVYKTGLRLRETEKR